MDKKFAIGVDIGGSHVTSMMVNLETRTVMDATMARQDVDCHGDADGILSAWAQAILDTMQHTDIDQVRGIGFAMPGPFDYPSGIARFKGVKKFDNLNGVDVRGEMEKRLVLPLGMPVRFMNDATCFAVGEAWMGEASGFERVVAITLGTGFGSSFISNGVPVESGPEVPPQGCVYHLPFGSSNADDNFSTRWFLGNYKKRKGTDIAGVKELAEQYSNDLVVQELFQCFGKNLGNFLSPWLALFRTDCLVIGGNISKNYCLFKEPFRKALIDNNLNELSVYISTLGEHSAIGGSARLSDDVFYRQLDITALK